MPRFTKKPVTIDAVQWTGENVSELLIFAGSAIELPGPTSLPEESFLLVHTLEGDMKADVGDWIIKGIQGEFYPCKPDIFDATYDAETKSDPLPLASQDLKRYIGVKIVLACPMSKAHWDDYSGQPVDIHEPSRPGYRVVYSDGYESWCPKSVFEAANRPTDEMPFGHAIEAAKKGHKIARRRWNGKNMFVVHMEALNLPPYNTQGTTRKVNDRTARFIGEDKPLNSQPYMAMYNAQEEWIPGWVATQSDVLGDDWYIVD